MPLDYGDFDKLLRKTRTLEKSPRQGVNRTRLSSHFPHHLAMFSWLWASLCACVKWGWEGGVHSLLKVPEVREAKECEDHRVFLPESFRLKGFLDKIRRKPSTSMALPLCHLPGWC